MIALINQDNISLESYEDVKYAKVEVDELKISWDELTCKLMNKKCH